MMLNYDLMRFMMTKINTRGVTVYPEEIDCRQGLTEIRTRWCKEHKDLDRFRPPERNTLHPV